MKSHTPTAVAVRELSKSFTKGVAGRSLVLENVSFPILAGQVIGLFGPSGCGKTTMLRILCGVLPYDAGEVSVFDLPLREQRGLVAYVPQRSELLNWKTLWDNALLGWQISHHGRDGSGEIVSRAQALFDRFGLTAVSDQYPQQSSGGERQRTALIRALLSNAPIMILDEPVAAIDHITRVRIYETLLGIVQENAEQGRPMTVLMVSHDPEELLLLCDRIYVMSSRPATIVNTIEVPFSRPRESGIKFEPEFVELKRTLWSLLS